MRRRVLAKPLALVAAPADTTAPTVPTNVTASSITATGFTLSWSASSDAVGVTGYVVQINGVTYATPTGTSIGVAGRSASTTYAVRVQARDAAGNFSALSTAINVTTPAASDVTAPTVPTNVTTSAVTATGFTVSWTASTDAVGVTGYDVQINGTSYATPTTTSVAVTGRSASTAYAVRVRARDAAGNFSALSTAVNVTTSAAAAAPQNIFTTQTPGLPNLSDGSEANLGTQFTPAVDGAVSGIRFFAATTAPTSAVGMLYTDTGTELARATFGTVTAGAWNSVTFTTPIAVTAGTAYRAAYFTSGPYAATANAFPVTNQNLTATAGFWDHNPTPTFPPNQATASYFADVIFTAGAVGSGGGGGAPIVAEEPSIRMGWAVTAANTGLAGAGVDKNTLPLYTGPNVLPRGTTITLKKITDPIEMYAGDCTLDRCWIVPTSLGSPVGALVSTIRFDNALNTNVESLVGNNVIKDCEIDGDTSLPLTLVLAESCAVAGVPMLIRNDIHGMGSGVAHIVTGPTLSAYMVNNYIHGCRGMGDAATTGSHNEAYTVRDFPDAPGRTLKIIGNRMECSTGPNDTGTLFIQPLWDSIYHMRITDNYLEGGGYNLYTENHGSFTYGDIVVTNNRFRPTAYGPATVSSGPGWTTFTENYIYNAADPNGKGTQVLQ